MVFLLPTTSSQSGVHCHTKVSSRWEADMGCHPAGAFVEYAMHAVRQVACQEARRHTICDIGEVEGKCGRQSLLPKFVSCFNAEVVGNFSKQVLNFPGWSGSCICWRCECSAADRDYSEDARWRTRRVFGAHFLAKQRHVGVVPSSMWQCPGFKP